MTDRVIRRLWAAVSVLMIMGTVSGCLPKTYVKKNPCDNDRGIRYYRPKPYLSIEPMLDRQGVPVPGYVTISHVVMPDFSEEYSIHVRSGLGVNNTSIKLENGWNLTAIDVKVDSQFDENIDAAAALIKALPIATAGAGGGKESATTVRAVNVPIGLYESVISTGSDGKKRLYGFRYVGFMPYAACPIESGGLECQTCHSDTVYALTFNQEGAMEFRPLPEVALLPEDRSKLGASKPMVERSEGAALHPPTVTSGPAVDLLLDDDRDPL